MSGNSEYFLTSGEFAKLCQTTKDTLRHYHEMGILTPQKNEENGYYYYSLSQVTSFYFINIFRQLDTPLKDIKSCLFTPDDEYYYDFCNKQLGNLYKMKNEIENKIAALGNATKLMNYMKQAPDGEPCIVTLQQRPVYYTTEITSRHSDSAVDISDDIRKHIERCNQKQHVHIFPVGVSINYEDFCKGHYQYRTLCSSISSEEIAPDIIRLPTNTVVGCSCKDSTTDIRNIYQKLQQYLVDNKLKVISDLFSISLFNFVDTNEQHRYLKYLFVCIEK